MDYDTSEFIPEVISREIPRIGGSLPGRFLESARHFPGHSSNRRFTSREIPRTLTREDSHLLRNSSPGDSHLLPGDSHFFPGRFSLFSREIPPREIPRTAREIPPREIPPREIHRVPLLPSSCHRCLPVPHPLPLVCAPCGKDTKIAALGKPYGKRPPTNAMKDDRIYERGITLRLLFARCPPRAVRR